ncbi:MAG: TonB-dependent receptor [Flavobacterium sp.]|nr:TonB-dependent receptor [Flavobacterium sp.]
MKLLIFFLFVIQSTIWSQIKKDTIISLPNVVVTALPIKNTVQESAAAVSVVSLQEINLNDGVILTPILNKVSGVLMQQGTLSTNRITIRGFGARSQFSTSRIKAYFENIPLTSGEGETTLEDIDLESLKSIEIIKGPNSTSFGAGLGGVIHLKGKTTAQETSFGKLATTFGSYNLLKQTISGGFSNASSSIYTSYNQIETDGFRNNSNYNRKSLNLFAKQKLSKKSELSIVGIATKLKAFIPSSLNERDFIASPEIAATTWQASQGYESYDKLLLGIGYQNDLSENWSLQTSVFSTSNDGYEPRPFDILDGKTINFGLRTTINNKTKLFSLPTKIAFGTEAMIEIYSYSLYENLYASQPGNGSIQGEKFNEQEQNRKYLNLFFQFEMQLTEKLKLEQGVAFNSTNYTQKEIIPNENSQKDKYTFGGIWSPRLGLSYKIVKGKNIYTSISKGFSVPTIAESLTPDGTINANLLPEIGINYEIGFKGDFLDKKLYTEISLYRANVTNLLVARRTGNDQFIGINAGKSVHQGFEFLANYNVVNDELIQVSTYFSGTITNSKFEDFIDLDSDYSGNKLPAIPNQQWTIGLDLATKNGLGFNTSFGKTGSMYLQDANISSIDAYSLWDAKINYTITLFKKLEANFNFGVQNILNEKYAANILPNAVAFGNAQPRYFYPGNPVNYYGGFAFNYAFK